jgi:hypothetical protein
MRDHRRKTEKARRENSKILFARHEMIKSSEREFGVTLSDEAKREPPVRTEPHPTRSFYLEVVSNSPYLRAILVSPEDICRRN